MDFDALMKKKLGGKYNKPSLVESLPQTEDGQDQAKPKNKGQKKATFKPRVTCSQCDFVGIDGKEMDIHRKKHDRSFNCKECQFVAKFRIVLRRHQIKEAAGIVISDLFQLIFVHHVLLWCHYFNNAIFF